MDDQKLGFGDGPRVSVSVSVFEWLSNLEW